MTWNIDEPLSKKFYCGYICMLWYLKLWKHLQLSTVFFWKQEFFQWLVKTQVVAGDIYGAKMSLVVPAGHLEFLLGMVPEFSSINALKLTKKWTKCANDNSKWLNKWKRWQPTAE